MYNVCQMPVLCYSHDKLFVIWVQQRQPPMTTKYVHTITYTLLCHCIESLDIPVVVPSLGQVLRLLGDGGLATSECLPVEMTITIYD